MKCECAPRFTAEKLGIHWQVDESKESFARLLQHLEIKTRIKPYFEEALASLKLGSEKYSDGIIAADIGAGVCWTSGILARHEVVKRIYAVDPSENRLAHARFVVKHFGVEDKVRIIRGTFLSPNIPEGVNIIVMCGSLHHCYDSQLEGLFTNIKRLLKPRGVVLIAGEHYVNGLWILKRLLSYVKNFGNRRTLYYRPFDKLRAPEPFGGEHWRTRKELSKIFRENGFSAEFFLHRGDMCKDKRTPYHKAGWRYYHAILRRSDGH